MSNRRPQTIIELIVYAASVATRGRIQLRPYDEMLSREPLRPDEPYVPMSPAPSAPRLVPRPQPVLMTPAHVTPADGPITSRFGMRMHPILRRLRLHAGVDIGARRGSDARVVGDGTVVSAGWQNGYGYTVVVDHGDGAQTVYAHLDHTLVDAGQHVTAGTVIGAVGATGRVTGAHLHFERRLRGEPVDPGTP